MLKTGDKIKYTKENSLIGLPLGTVFIVTDVKGTVVALETKIEVGNMTGVAQCVMSYDEYEKYFEKVVETETKTEVPKRVWTEWKAIEDKYENDITTNAITNCGNTYCAHCNYNSICAQLYLIEYRTNGKKVMVRYKINDNKHIKAEATCYKTDTFNLIKGLKIACSRLGLKIAKYNVEQIIKEIG